MTTTYPIKPPLYAITKTTNYLPNVLMQMEAKEAGFDNGVFMDPAGHVGESSNMNVAFVTTDGVLAHPKFDHILSGCTSLRLLELAPACATGSADRDRGSRHHRRRGARVARDAAHRQLDQGGADRPVGHQVVGNGKPGPVAAALLRVLEEDMRTGDRLIDVPYDQICDAGRIASKASIGSPPDWPASSASAAGPRRSGRPSRRAPRKSSALVSASRGFS